jgi:hypothetical protein
VVIEKDPLSENQDPITGDKWLYYTTYPTNEGPVTNVCHLKHYPFRGAECETKYEIEDYNGLCSWKIANALMKVKSIFMTYKIGTVACNPYRNGYVDSPNWYTFNTDVYEDGVGYYYEY